MQNTGKLKNTSEPSGPYKQKAHLTIESTSSSIHKGKKMIDQQKRWMFHAYL